MPFIHLDQAVPDLTVILVAGIHWSSSSLDWNLLISANKSTLLFSRIACVVCSHKPIFDTIQMLAVHRGGKKHIASK